jgi:hypothetical protein
MIIEDYVFSMWLTDNAFDGMNNSNCLVTGESTCSEVIFYHVEGMY